MDVKSFKSSVLQTDNKTNIIKVDKYYDWDTVNSMMQEHFERKECNDRTHIIREEKFNIMFCNDDLVYNETKYLKDKFFFKGILLNEDMEKLINIYVKNMHIEEIIIENDDDDFYYEEEEIIL